MEHRVLIIENDPAILTAIHKNLARTSDGPFKIVWVRQLSEALERLSKEAISAVLVDLFLPDSQSINTFVKISAAAPHVPIMVLVGLDDEDIAKEAVERGAHDYLLKNRLDSYSVTRALRSMIGRKAADDAALREKERAEITLDSIGDAVISTDVSGNITYLNQVAELLTGWSWKAASGRPFADVFHIIDGDTREIVRNPMQLAIKQGQTVRLTSPCVLVRRDGFESAIEERVREVQNEAGASTGFGPALDAAEA